MASDSLRERDVNELTVGVVIRALNEEEHIGRLLVGLKRQTRPPDQVVMVDSGSTDSTVAIAKHMGAHTVHIAAKDFTFGRSLNVGFEACTTDIVLVLSAHVYPVFDSCVAHLLAPFSKPNMAVTYGRQLGDDRTQFSESRIMRRWFPESGSGVQDHPFSNNANACVRRSTWDALRYDEELTGLEDIDFAKRAQDKGWCVAYVAESPVVHVHEETRDQIQNRYRREAIAYARLHPGWRMGPWDAIGAVTRNIAADWAQALLERRSPKQLGQIASFRVAQFFGAWEGSRDGQNVSEQLRQRMYYPASVRPSSNFASRLGQPIDYSEIVGE
jgi:rhamnosyltransferase